AGDGSDPMLNQYLYRLSNVRIKLKCIVMTVRAPVFGSNHNTITRYIDLIRVTNTYINISLIKGITIREQIGSVRISVLMNQINMRALKRHCFHFKHLIFLPSRLYLAVYTLIQTYYSQI